MKTVTYEEFLEFDPCWLDKEDGAERIKSYFDHFGGKMSVLDILKLEDMRAEDKLWSVLRKEFIPAPILHEFACVCAEFALSLVRYQDPRSIRAIEVKRAWLRGEATDEELYTAARDAARAASAVARDAASWEATCAATCAAAWDAVAWDAATYAASTASTACAAWDATWDATEATVFEAQVAYLIMVLEEEK